MFFLLLDLLKLVCPFLVEWLRLCKITTNFIFCAVVEYCGVSSRTVPLLMVMMSYTLASLTVPWVAMVLPTWRLLSVIAAVAILPVVLCWR